LRNIASVRLRIYDHRSGQHARGGFCSGGFLGVSFGGRAPWRGQPGSRPLQQILPAVERAGAEAAVRWSATSGGLRSKGFRSDRKSRGGECCGRFVAGQQCVKAIRNVLGHCFTTLVRADALSCDGQAEYASATLEQYSKNLGMRLLWNFQHTGFRGRPGPLSPPSILFIDS
jgi:hypothetical protein